MRRSGKELKVDPESGRFEGVHEFKEMPELLEERKRAYVEQLQDELTLYKEKLRKLRAALREIELDDHWNYHSNFNYEAHVAGEEGVCHGCLARKALEA